MTGNHPLSPRLEGIVARTAESPAPEAAITVAGARQDIWEPVATGPGLSTWFLPAIVEQHVGGTILQRRGAGEDDVSRGTIRIYETLRRLRYEERTDDGTVDTEILVEPRSSDSCQVRILTHGLPAHDRASTTALIDAWTQALATLRIYQEFFRGDALRALGLTEDGLGRPTGFADEEGPSLTIELLQPYGLLARLDVPRRGVVRESAADFGGSTTLILDRFLYGFVALAHLQAGSIRVSVGRSLIEGEHMAACGNSGNSTQPHVHLQAMDSPDLFIA